MASFYVRTNRGSTSETFENPNSCKSGLYILQLLISYVNLCQLIYNVYVFSICDFFYMFLLIFVLFVGWGIC